MTKTLKEWCEEAKSHGVTVLDPDGFNRSDPNMWDKTYTKAEFLAGLPLCTCNWTREFNRTDDPFWVA